MPVTVRQKGSNLDFFDVATIHGLRLLGTKKINYEKNNFLTPCLSFLPPP